MELLEQLWSWARKEPTKSFRWILPIMIAFTLAGQEDIKKQIVAGKMELVERIDKVDKKIDASNERREVILKDYNDWRRDTEGRISFLEASTGLKKRARPF